MVATRRAKVADDGESHDDSQPHFVEPAPKRAAKTPAKTAARKEAPATDAKSVMKGARTPRTRSRANAPLTPATPADDIPDAVDDANDAAQVAEPPTVSKRGKRAVAQPATNETAEAKVQHAETTLTAAVQKSSGKKKRFDDDDDDDLNLLEEGPYIATAAELPPSNAAKPQPVDDDDEDSDDDAPEAVSLSTARDEAQAAQDALRAQQAKEREQAKEKRRVAEERAQERAVQKKEKGRISLAILQAMAEQTEREAEEEKRLAEERRLKEEEERRRRKKNKRKFDDDENPQHPFKLVVVEPNRAGTIGKEIPAEALAFVKSAAMGSSRIQRAKGVGLGAPRTNKPAKVFARR